MESLMRPKIRKAYGRTKANAPCKKHPKHTQSPGVCSRCLNEKLFRLTNATVSSRPKRAANSLSSSSYISSLSSSDDSSYSSPVLSYAGSRARKSTRLFKNVGQETLRKSRSMAFFSQTRKEDDQNGSSVQMKRGFWSKLLSTKNKALMHSRTTRERVQ